MTCIRLPEEDERIHIVKHLKVDGLGFAEMVPVLKKLNLLTCRKCEDGTAQHRRNRQGVDICVHCEDNLTQQWRRYLPMLETEVVDILEARWQYVAALNHLRKLCLDNATVNAKKRTRRRVAGKTEIIVTEERRINHELLRLAKEIDDTLARVHGADKQPRAYEKTRRKKVEIVLAAAAEPTAERPN